VRTLRTSREQRRCGDGDPEDDSHYVGDDETPAPDPIGRKLIDQRVHANLSFSGLRG
jgi:hypothetical protein